MQEDLEYLAAAYGGRLEMLGAIFGSSDDPVPTSPPSSDQPQLPVLTPDAFDRVWDKPGLVSHG